ncbi:conserved hypothetical protein [Ricinus communis]|uniref:Uncharacterized protein n=1 Tax=Ricinus communis TaxID=3988 RepID=B9T7Q7_RICCO|nr:conserved hypothetical protein [Ricinus communis]
MDKTERRDHVGLFKAAFQKRVVGLMTPSEAEDIGVTEALSWLKNQQRLG